MNQDEVFVFVWSRQTADQRRTENSRLLLFCMPGCSCGMKTTLEQLKASQLLEGKFTFRSNTFRPLTQNELFTFPFM